MIKGYDTGHDNRKPAAVEKLEAIRYKESSLDKKEETEENCTYPAAYASNTQIESEQ